MKQWMVLLLSIVLVLLLSAFSLPVPCEKKNLSQKGLPTESGFTKSILIGKCKRVMPLFQQNEFPKKACTIFPGTSMHGNIPIDAL